MCLLLSTTRAASCGDVSKDCQFVEHHGRCGGCSSAWDPSCEAQTYGFLFRPSCKARALKGSHRSDAEVGSAGITVRGGRGMLSSQDPASPCPRCVGATGPGGELFMSRPRYVAHITFAAARRLLFFILPNRLPGTGSCPVPTRTHSLRSQLRRHCGHAGFSGAAPLQSAGRRIA